MVKELLRTRTSTEKLALFMVAFLGLATLLFVLFGCSLFCNAHEASEGAATIGRTIRYIDADKGGTITFEELISYLVGGYFGGRAVETCAKIGVRKVWNGRKAKHGSSDCEA